MFSNSLQLQLKLVSLVVNLAKLDSDLTTVKLPTFEESLRTQLNLEENKIYREYTDHFNQFTEFKEVAELRKRLEQEIKLLAGQRVQENLDALTKAVSIPLTNAMSIVKLSAAKYDTVWEFKTFVKKVCSGELAKGKAMEWSEEMRSNVIDNFIHNDEYIQNEIQSRDGIFSMIKGWIMWILSFFFN